MRDYLAGQTGGATQDVLTGMTPADRIDPGPIICACLNVGINTIVTAIETRAALSVDALGQALGAGTNCGSCKPELAALVAQHRMMEAAE